MQERVRISPSREKKNSQHYSKIAQVFYDWSSFQTKDVKKKPSERPSKTPFSLIQNENKTLDGGNNGGTSFQKIKIYAPTLSSANLC